MNSDNNTLRSTASPSAVETLSPLVEGSNIEKNLPSSATQRAQSHTTSGETMEGGTRTSGNVRGPGEPAQSASTVEKVVTSSPNVKSHEVAKRTIHNVNKAMDQETDERSGSGKAEENEDQTQSSEKKLSEETVSEEEEKTRRSSIKEMFHTRRNRSPPPRRLELPNLNAGQNMRDLSLTLMRLTRTMIPKLVSLWIVFLEVMPLFLTKIIPVLRLLCHLFFFLCGYFSLQLIGALTSHLYYYLTLFLILLFTQVLLPILQRYWARQPLLGGSIFVRLFTSVCLLYYIAFVIFPFCLIWPSEQCLLRPLPWRASRMWNTVPTDELPQWRLACSSMPDLCMPSENMNELLNQFCMTSHGLTYTLANPFILSKCPGVSHLSSLATYTASQTQSLVQATKQYSQNLTAMLQPTMKQTLNATGQFGVMMWSEIQSSWRGLKSALHNATADT